MPLSVVGSRGTKSRHETPSHRWSSSRASERARRIETGRESPLSVPSPRIEHMIEMLERGAERVEDDLSASRLLASIATARHVENRGRRRPARPRRPVGRPPPARVDPLGRDLHRPGCEHEEPIAGEGTPLVAEFCFAELGAVLGMSTTAAKKLVGHALELRHRLPAAVGAGPGRCGPGVAGPVGRGDHHPHHARPHRRGGRVGGRPGRRGRRPDRSRAARPARRRDHQALRPRRSQTRPRTRRTATSTSTPATPRCTTRTSTSPAPCAFEAELDIADALDLNHALAHGAATLKALGSDESLDVRRAKALGDLARTQTALDLAAAGRVAGEDRAGVPRPDLPGRSPRGRPPRPLRRHRRRRHDGLRPDRPAGGRPAPRPARPGQGLVRRHPDQGDHQARHRPQRRALRAGLRDPRPDPRTGHPPRPHLRLPVVHPTRPTVGDVDHIVEYDHHAEAEGRPQPGPTDDQQPRRACAAATTASRPTPPGTTGWSSPESSSGPAPTATSSSANDHDPAPHPASPHDGGATGTSVLSQPTFIAADTERADLRDVMASGCPGDRAP